MGKDKGRDMFREVRLLRIPSVALFKTDPPQEFTGGLRQEFQDRGLDSRQLSTLSNPTTKLKCYSKLFFKISNRNLL